MKDILHILLSNTSAIKLTLSKTASINYRLRGITDFWVSIEDVAGEKERKNILPFVKSEKICIFLQ